MAAPLVSDALWSLFSPLLPPHPPRPKGGRPPINARATLTGILFVLKSGIPWEMLPQEMGCGSGMTCWRRLRDWQEAGIWQAFHHTLLDRLGRAGLIDWSRCSLDAASLPAKAGGAATGPNPTDRGKPGSKRHLVVDRQGIPLAVLLTAANVHDSTMLDEALDAVPPVRQPPVIFCLTFTGRMSRSAWLLSNGTSRSRMNLSAGSRSRSRRLISDPIGPSEGRPR